nr:ABC transporter substrate-binding protein [Rhodococcus qingshengii]
MYGNGIIASDQLIADDPDKVTRFMSATMKGVKWACDNPEQSAAALLNNVRETDQASADAGVAAACSLLRNAENATTGLGSMTDEGASHVIDMTTEFLKADNAQLSPSDLYTNEFLDTTLTESTIVDEPTKTTR